MEIIKATGHRVTWRDRCGGKRIACTFRKKALCVVVIAQELQDIEVLHSLKVSGDLDASAALVRSGTARGGNRYQPLELPPHLEHQQLLHDVDVRDLRPAARHDLDESSRNSSFLSASRTGVRPIFNRSLSSVSDHTVPGFSSRVTIISSSLCRASSASDRGRRTSSMMVFAVLPVFRVRLPGNAAPIRPRRSAALLRPLVNGDAFSDCSHD